MKKLLSALIFTTSVTVLFAQQDEQFTQNMYNKLPTNPGYAGTTGSICVKLLGRQQWLTFPGAPKSYLMSIDAPVQLLHGGLGLTVRNDALGMEDTYFVKAAYSFHQVIGPGILGIGLEGGIIQKHLDDKWIPPDGQSTIGPDQAIPDVQSAALTYDLGFGLFYRTDQLYVGLSSTHLPQQDLKDKDLKFEVARHYYVQAGYDFNIGSEFKLSPHVFVKSDAASTIFDINLTGTYHDLVWLGASYRMTDAIAVMAGLNVKPNANSNLKIGYSYDITTSELKNYSNNTHELMLGYCLKIVRPPHTQSHINPRFLK